MVASACSEDMLVESVPPQKETSDGLSMALQTKRALFICEEEVQLVLVVLQGLLRRSGCHCGCSCWLGPSSHSWLASLWPGARACCPPSPHRPEGEHLLQLKFFYPGDVLCTGMQFNVQACQKPE